MKKKLFSLLCCLSLLACSNSVYAKECEAPCSDSSVIEAETSEKVDVLVEDNTRGSKKPKDSASTHKLGVNNYNYQLDNFGYKLFTNVWLQSSSGYITVYLTDFSVLENHGGTSNKITFKLYDSSGLLVSSEKTVVAGTASVTWKNISSSKKYYVAFEVPTNGNRYSGAGYITD